MQFDATPDDRNHLAVYIQKIKTEHKPGPDGNLIAVDKIYFGKKLSPGFQNIVEVERLKKDNPFLWSKTKPIYEEWKVSRTITREGLPLDSWPAITEGQIEMCKGNGLFVVEDLATASDALRQKLGPGSNDLIAKAKAFNANKDASKAANRITTLESQVAQLAKDNEEARATIDALMAERGKTAVKPARRKKEEDSDG
jgi:hypothetical protein